MPEDWTMEERERGAGRPIDDGRDETHSARSEPHGEIEAASVAPEEAEFQRQMETARRGMRKHRSVLAVLAK